VRFATPDGQWRVDVIRLSGTSDNRNGEWYRIAQYGIFTAEVRTTQELGTIVPMSELEEVA
jgi:hypothetical protein